MGIPRLTIDLDAIAANWRLLTELAAPAEVTAVVKADAYGLGVQPVARRLAEAGCGKFFVATLDEGVELRRFLPDAVIAVLSAPVRHQARDFVAHGLYPVLNQPGDLDAWRAEGRGLPAWLHIDTGMHRLGFSQSEWQKLLASAPVWERLGVIGLISHYACADDPEHPLNVQQRDAAHAAARDAGLPLSLGNSSAIFLGPAYRGDLVRPGMALYGLNPTPYRANPMRSAIRLDAQVLQVRRVEAHGTTGYGASAEVRSGQILVTLGLGYADGLFRILSNKASVFFDGMAAPVQGRVSMDSVVVDVTHLGRRPSPGDWAEVIGPNQSADSLADAAGTIGYEVLTSLGHRYARTYRYSESDA